MQNNPEGGTYSEGVCLGTHVLTRRGGGVFTLLRGGVWGFGTISTHSLKYKNTQNRKNFRLRRRDNNRKNRNKPYTPTRTLENVSVQ